MDTTLTIERITHALDTTFAKCIDMADAAHELESQQRGRFLSRALAAFAIRSLTDVDPIQACAAVTDGYGDQGIDAIYVDTSDKAVYIVQSKWSKTPDQGDIEKFLSGIHALIRCDFSAFNEKLRRRETELRANFLYRSDNRVVLVLAYGNHQALGEPAERQLLQFIEQQNNVGDLDVFSVETFDLKRIYGRLSGSANGKINFQIALREWGTINEPYRAYYGQVLLTDVASWATYGKALFDKNLRFYRGSTDVNGAMEKTVSQSPGHFWYFNNGITILCREIEKAVIGGVTRDYGIFDCTGISVINGAQTVGVIWEIAHGNRFILRRVFLDPQVEKIWRNPSAADAEFLGAAKDATERELATLADLIQKMYPDAYLATLFKNLQKCKDLDTELSYPNGILGQKVFPFHTTL